MAAILSGGAELNEAVFFFLFVYAWVWIAISDTPL